MTFGSSDWISRTDLFVTDTLFYFSCCPPSLLTGTAFGFKTRTCKVVAGVAHAKVGGDLTESYAESASSDSLHSFLFLRL